MNFAASEHIRRDGTMFDTFKTRRQFYHFKFANRKRKIERNRECENERWTHPAFQM